MPLSVAVVDDDPFIREAYGEALRGCALAVFADASQWLAAASQPGHPSKWDVVVLDYFLDPSGAETGASLARRLRPGYDGLILLATDADVGANEAALFDAIVRKHDVDRALLEGLVIERAPSRSA